MPDAAGVRVWYFIYVCARCMYMYTQMDIDVVRYISVPARLVLEVRTI